MTDSDVMTSERDDMSRQLQPHLAASGTPGVDNPALALDDGDVKVNIQDTSNSNAASPHLTWERFDDADVEATQANAGTRNSVAQNGNLHHQTESGGQTNGKAPGVSPSSTPQQQQQTTVERPVVYNCQSGEAVVVSGCVMTSTGPGTGSSVIATQRIPERWREQERPLRARQMKILKVLSVIAAVLFFPSGIPAAYFAWRTKKEFDEGILRGNIDRAQKFARRTERLIILSAILLVVTVVLVFALIERVAHGYNENHSYVAHASVHG